jgi:hypothetical protein
VTVGAEVHGVAGCGGVGKEFIAAEAVVGERGAAGIADAWVDEDSGTEVGMLGKEETYSTMKSS